MVTPISCIEYDGRDLDVPATGPITERVWKDLISIQYGALEHPDEWSVKI